MRYKHKQLHAREVVRIAIFGTLFVASIVLSIIGLNGNSQGAKDRYESLIAADKAGADVVAPLNELRSYIYGHMNTQIGSDTGIHPPIQLQGTYERLIQTEKDRVAQKNVTLYADAQASCEQQQPTGFSGRTRLDCIEAYVDANGEKERAIEDDVYKFDFVPPVWSADLAGFSIIATGIFGMLLFVHVLMYFRTRHAVHMSR